jgi:tripartite-type tricarboxylate transporter receptor subunit TctC
MPIMLRRIFFIALLAFVALAGAAALAQDNYPAKPVRIVIPYTAGSSLDSRGRVIAHALSERLGQQVIVDNRPGAGGSIGTALVAKSPADGLTLLLTNNSYALNPYVYKDAGYDPLKDLVPIAHGYTAAMVLVVHPSAAVKTVRELAAFGKAKPEEISYASSGNGSVPHLCAEIFNQLAGIKALHVPFKGDAQALSDVLAGRLTFIFSGIVAAQPHVKAGKLRALAVTTPKRIDSMPDVPTMAEAGYPTYNLPVWAGFFAPAGTPKSILDKLNKEIGAALVAPAVKANMDATGATAIGGNSADFSALVRKEVERYAKLAKEIGLTIE